MNRLGAAVAAVVVAVGGAVRADASTAPPEEVPAAAFAGLHAYFDSVSEAELVDDDGFAVGECPLLPIDDFARVAELSGADGPFDAEPASVMPLTIERLGTLVAVRCVFHGGDQTDPGIRSAEINVLDLVASPEIERQLDQMMRGSLWQPVTSPYEGELAGRCYSRRDRDECPVAWKNDAIAVAVAVSFGLGEGDVDLARRVFDALLIRVFEHLGVMSPEP